MYKKKKKKMKQLKDHSVILYSTFQPLISMHLRIYENLHEVDKASSLALAY